MNENKIKSENNKNINDEIYTVLIINSHYVRWEIFTKKDTIDDLHDLLYKKYNIEVYTAEINNIYMYVKKKNFSCKELCKKNHLLIDFCDNDNLSLTIRVTTKEENFKLKKNTF